MVAHLAGPAGGPPPPTEREARLQAELRAAREAISDMRDFIDRSHARQDAPRSDDYWRALTVARSGLRAYDQAVEQS